MPLYSASQAGGWEGRPTRGPRVVHEIDEMQGTPDVDLGRDVGPNTGSLGPCPDPLILPSHPQQRVSCLSPTLCPPSLGSQTRLPNVQLVSKTRSRTAQEASPRFSFPTNSHRNRSPNNACCQPYARTRFCVSSR